MFKKLLIIFIVYLCCKLLSYQYNYTDHRTYIYKFKDNNVINYKGIYGESIDVSLDSITYNKYTTDEYRKNWYIIRKFDDGRIFILTDNYILNKKK